MGAPHGAGHQGVMYDLPSDAPMCGRCGHLLTAAGRCLNCQHRVLVTGGLGFIGSEIVARLLADGHEVVVLDSLTYAGSVDRLLDVGISSHDVTLLWHDLRAPMSEGLDKKIGPIDVVVNAAASTHVDRSISNPLDFFYNNTLIALNMLEWARTRSLLQFFQVSTDEVYGPAPEGYSHKEWDPIIPSNPYSGSKAAQEAAAISYWRTFGVPVVLTNTMNNIGPRQHSEKFVPLAIKKLMMGEPVPIHARKTEGVWESSSRCWLDTKVHADALAFLIQRPAGLYPAMDRPDRWHVVGEELACDEMVFTMAGFMGVTARVEYVDFHYQRPGHDHRYALSGERLAAAGWISPITFRDALHKTVNWYLEHPQWLGL